MEWIKFTSFLPRCLIPPKMLFPKKLLTQAEFEKRKCQCARAALLLLGPDHPHTKLSRLRTTLRSTGALAAAIS